MKFASRYLLPIELMISILFVGWGVAGWFGTGTLVRMLSELGIGQSWGLSMVFLGLTQLTVSGVEFAFGRDWDNDKIFRSTSARCVVLFFGTLLWVYVLTVILSLTIEHLPVALLMQAPAAAIFSIWAWCGNMKVRVLLNPAIATTRLQETIMLDRRKLAGME